MSFARPRMTKSGCLNFCSGSVSEVSVIVKDKLAKGSSSGNSRLRCRLLRSKCISTSVGTWSGGTAAPTCSPHEIISSGGTIRIRTTDKIKHTPFHLCDIPLASCDKKGGKWYLLNIRETVEHTPWLGNIAKEFMLRTQEEGHPPSLIFHTDPGTFGSNGRCQAKIVERFIPQRIPPAFPFLRTGVAYYM